MGTSLQHQRDLYERLLETQDRPFWSERPAVFSPAAAAQDQSGHTGLFFNWTPLFLPFEYSGWLHETRSYMTHCFIGDWTAIAKVGVKGRQAREFLSWIGMNDLRRFDIGQVKHHVQLDERGYVASEGVVYRTGEESYCYTGGNGDWTLYQFQQQHWDADIADLSADLFIFEVQGPTSLAALEAATGESLRDIGFNRGRPSRINGHEVYVLRTGITGELGYELHGSADHAAEVWQAVVAAGQPFGIRELGVRSQLISHIEAGIATNGIDYLPSALGTPGSPRLVPKGRPGGSFIPTGGLQDYFRRPGELGWGRRGPLDSHDFIGRAALLEEAAAGGPSRVLMGLVWNVQDVVGLYADLFGDAPLPEQMDMPREIGLSHDVVLQAGRAVGVSTSRVFSTNLRKMISLCVIDRALAQPGMEVQLLWGRPGSAQREIRATVSALPFKEDRRRIDVQAL